MRSVTLRYALILSTVVALFGCRASRPSSEPAPPPGIALQPASAVSTGAPLPDDHVRFVDITKQAGIQFVHFSGARGKKYMPECETPGCAFIDYNADGRPDILLLNGADWPEQK